MIKLAKLAPIALVCLGVVLLAGCTNNVSTGVASTIPTATQREAIVDPLAELTDPKSSAFIAKRLVVLLHSRGHGSRTYEIPRPTDSTSVIRFFLACAPEAHFVIRIGTFYAGGCAKRFQSSGGFPASTWGTDAPLRVSLKLPKSDKFWLVAIQQKKMGS